MAQYAFIKDGEVKAVLQSTPDFVLNSSFDPGCQMLILGDVVPAVGDVSVGGSFVTPERFSEAPKGNR